MRRKQRLTELKILNAQREIEEKQKHEERKLHQTDDYDLVESMEVMTLSPKRSPHKAHRSPPKEKLVSPLSAKAYSRSLKPLPAFSVETSAYGRLGGWTADREKLYQYEAAT